MIKINYIKNKYVFVWGFKKGIKLINLIKCMQFMNLMTNSTGNLADFFFYFTLFISNRYFLCFAIFCFYSFFDLLTLFIRNHRIKSYFYFAITYYCFSILNLWWNYPKLVRLSYFYFYFYVCKGFIVLLIWGNLMIQLQLFHYPQNLTHIW
mgnify:CR=1 FL=1